jgi:hypothetical protein
LVVLVPATDIDIAIIASPIHQIFEHISSAISPISFGQAAMRISSV